MSSKKIEPVNGVSDSSCLFDSKEMRIMGDHHSLSSLNEMDSNKLKAEIKRWAKAVVAYARQLSSKLGSSRRKNVNGKGNYSSSSSSSSSFTPSVFSSFSSLSCSTSSKDNEYESS
ncbi:hypothetical protein ACFE04_004038 [Oxalis oulophora]